jgi:cytochrome P450
MFLKYKQSNIITTADRAREILKSSDYSRCKPNKWLVNTLSIVNSFTINSESLLKMFKNEVIKTLAKWSNDEKYEDLMLTIRSRIQHRLSILQSNNSTFCLSKLVKQVTLDSFLSGILNVNANEDLITELPDLIIHLWKNHDDKKAQDRLQELLLANKDDFSKSEFWQQIQTILSNHSAIISQTAANDFDEKISNPLNIIVPGWETMWRVVFYSLLELLRHPKLLEELRSELNDHLKSYRKCLLLQCILKETLRLYPPTKNIYRTNLKTSQDIRINVQQIHRDKNVWGFNALDFCPDRFKEKLTVEQEKCYLPFSISCPARHGFAYGFAGAIVAEVLQHCPTFTIAEGFSSLPTDQLLEMARDSYNDLLINLWFHRSFFFVF